MEYLWHKLTRRCRRQSDLCRSILMTRKSMYHHHCMYWHSSHHRPTRTAKCCNLLATRHSSHQRPKRGTLCCNQLAENFVRSNWDPGTHTTQWFHRRRNYFLEDTWRHNSHHCPSYMLLYCTLHLRRSMRRQATMEMPLHNLRLLRSHSLQDLGSHTRCCSSRAIRLQPYCAFQTTMNTPRKRAASKNTNDDTSCRARHNMASARTRLKDSNRRRPIDNSQSSDEHRGRMCTGRNNRRHTALSSWQGMQRMWMSLGPSTETQLSHTCKIHSRTCLGNSPHRPSRSQQY